jgi:hypothetical protein
MITKTGVFSDFGTSDEKGIIGAVIITGLYRRGQVWWWNFQRRGMLPAGFRDPI